MIDKIAKYAPMQKNMFNYGAFYNFIAQQLGFKTFVEIGVWKGHAITYLASQLKNKNVKIYAVDIFSDRTNGDKYRHCLPEPDWDLAHTYDMYKYNVEAAGVRNMIEDVCGCSWEMADQFEDKYFDFIFIDADHSYECVVRDIKAWRPKIKKGGILAGHDYNAPNVRMAVKDTCGDKAIAYSSCRCVWYIA